MTPLAARMRPATIEEYVGQEHILQPGKPLYEAISAQKLHSMIFWGPPGTGKTTLAEMVASHNDAHLVRLSAVTSGVKDIREAVAQAKANRDQFAQRTILFVDEVHRFNKAQQDAFLPHIEDGTITFIGATTENPGFELNRALLSRVRLYTLHKLSAEHIRVLLSQTLDKVNASVTDKLVSINEDARTLLIEYSSGDARRSLNCLELAMSLTTDGLIEKHHIAEAIEGRVVQFDKQGDHFYDLISAFHKSVRGSAPDAALYWYCRMIEAGAEPLYVARRLLAIASEDIGNADPRALQITMNAWDIFHRVGPAEGERAIAQAAVYCACAPKSNALYKAFSAARQLAKDTSDLDVPLHLRNAPTSVAKSLGHGDSYRYAHNEPYAFAAGEAYFPEEIKDQKLYAPVERGLEIKIKEKLRFLDELNHGSQNKRYD
ncbi:MAG: replication-associated recombination protein A [Aestuariibacter sp.]